MRRALLIALAVLAASCSSDTSGNTTEQSAASSIAPSSSAETTSPPTTSSETAATTTTVATTSTAPSLPESTTTTLGAGNPDIRIEEIVFAGEPYLIIGNRGGGPGSTEGYWICQFPDYYELPAVELQPGDRLAVPLGDGDVPDLVGVVATAEVEFPLGPVSRSDGELGLYTASSFNSSDAIVDYVEWGSGGHARSSVAVGAGIWVEGGFVDVPVELLAIVAQASQTLGPEDWFAEIGG